MNTKPIFFISFSLLFGIIFLLLIEINNFYTIQWSQANIIIAIFGILFVMLILILFINILFNFILDKFTSYKINQEKVLITIFLVNEILFLITYLLLEFNNQLFFTLQNYKYITPIIFSLLFSVLLGLKIKDIIYFNVGIISATILLFISQKLFLFLIKSF
ncbi:hypothetical protein AN960_21075 [Bacillus sp. FJAT-25509]|uniref:hypothetical protein n=1 Tax=Bacillus sp. FJAT-25509 TaxID=1712029 RepID=UPI000701D4FE|nr:hypothetical protein [Bacillus sp. FJAT-25509]KQL33565.1 hypothetical protein AN960_21075 [Bacillus sp. FJAT-25509]